MAERTQRSNILLAFISLTAVIAVVSLIGFFTLGKGPEIIQGQAEADEYRVSGKVPARILELRVKEGDKVKAGDTLVILEAPDVMAKLSQAQAAEQAARAISEKAQRGTRWEQLQAAFEMWQKAKAGVEIAEKSYNRVNRLFEQGVMSAQKRDEAKAQFDAMAATEKAARSQYEMAKNGARQEDKAAAAAQVERAKGAVAEVSSYMDETILTAAADGEVTEIFPKVGELVGTGAPIMNIARLDDMWVTFNVREDFLKDFTVGEEINAFIPAFDKEVKFKVTYMKDLGTYAAWKATKTTGQFDLKTFEVKAVPVEMRTTHIIFQIAKREVFRIATRPLYLFCMVIAPLFCYIFFTTLMWNGLPTDMPAGVVDLDNTATTRNIIRNLDAFQQTKIVAHYAGFADARKAMQEGKIYAFYFIPEGTTAKALASRQPKVSFYTNYSYLVAGSLLYKDQRTMSELASGAIGRATLRAKGATDDQAVAFLQPIVIDSHILNNPWLNYSVYLSNTIIPGILMLLIFMTTIYTIGSEIKGNTQKEWMQMADNSVTLALSGKLLPQTLIFFIMATFYNVYLYGFLHYPCNSGILPMLLAGLLLVLASQAFGIFLFGLFTTMRLALSTASLWGVISFSISGMSFPVMAMNPVLQGLASLFPLRHYFLIYVNLALNGYPLIYAWHSVVALMLFMLLPFFILKRLRTVLLHYVYIP